MKNWLIDFLIMNTFIIIPIYAALIISSAVYIIYKTIRCHFEYEKFLKITKDLSKNSENTIKELKEGTYNIKKDLNLLRFIKDKFDKK